MNSLILALLILAQAQAFTIKAEPLLQNPTKTATENFKQALDLILEISHCNKNTSGNKFLDCAKPAIDKQLPEPMMRKIVGLFFSLDGIIYARECSISELESVRDKSKNTYLLCLYKKNSPQKGMILFSKDQTSKSLLISNIRVSY